MQCKVKSKTKFLYTNNRRLIVLYKIFYIKLLEFRNSELNRHFEKLSIMDNNNEILGFISVVRVCGKILELWV